MRTLLRLGLAGLILVATYFAILRIAEHKADILAGGDCFRLAPPRSSEMDAFSALLEQLRGWNEDALADELQGLQAEGHLWVAPHLPGERSAVTVKSLGVVSRVFVRSDELTDRRLPFPNLPVPREAQETFMTIRLAGTLYHELLHYHGLEDEGATYDREIDWYRHLRDGVSGRLWGESQRWFDWALDSALKSARAARAQATGAGGSE